MSAINLNYKVFGQGEPLIILHGLFGSLDNWQTIARRLAEQYTVFIVDQRNHGRSPHTEQFDYSLMAEDLYEFMNSNWIYSARLMGHSMGGKTAMQFAQTYPDMVKQLAVVDIGPRKNKPGHEDIFKAMFSLDVNRIGNRKEADKILQTTVPEYATRQFLLKNLAKSKEGGYRWKMNLPVIYDNYKNVLAEIEPQELFESPTLFVKGGKSNYLQLDDLPLIRQLFPLAQMKTIPQAGHWVHADAPAEFQTMMENFFLTV